MDEDIDLGVGFRLAVRPGSVVRRGDPLGEVHAASPSRAEAGAAALRAAVAVGDGAAPLRALVSHRVTTAGVSVYPPVG